MGLVGILPCSVGANHCRLRYIGWEKCGHESSSELFVDELLGLFRYPRKSGRALLTGTLPLRYCADRFGLQDPHLAAAGVWSCCSPGCHKRRLMVVMGVRFLVQGFPGLVVLVLGGKELD